MRGIVGSLAGASVLWIGTEFILWLKASFDAGEFQSVWRILGAIAFFFALLLLEQWLREKEDSTPHARV